MTLTDAVKAEARRLGFSLVGITTPDPPQHYAVFERWSQAGRHGEMGYLDTERSRQRRYDPRQILPECRSILVLGVGYPDSPVGEEGSTPSPHLPHGRVASYAWGDDYHEVLPARLQELAVFIQEQVGRPVPYRCYTDSGPLLERDLAQRAGLGWIGKNTCLIHPHLGSYFFLAEVLLGIDLQPDRPFASDHCGTCTRCLEACPTQCILPDRTLDARHCISYLTIELKGAIPPDLRPQMGPWVFGCDICQQACPWNLRFAASAADPQFIPRPGLPQPDLGQELALTPPAFNQKFRRNPVQRARRRGYLRNVAVAPGVPEPGGHPALASALVGDEEPLVARCRLGSGRLAAAAHNALEMALGTEASGSAPGDRAGATPCCWLGNIMPNPGKLKPHAHAAPYLPGYSFMRSVAGERLPARAGNPFG
jgi:epoxyqueuosine reductase